MHAILRSEHVPNWLLIGVIAGASLAPTWELVAETPSQGPPARPASECQDKVQVIERQVAALFGEAKAATVRIAWGEHWEQSASGVILTPHGHVATWMGRPLGTGTPITFYLADGRSVMGKAIGSWESIALLKIDGDGPWTCARRGKSAEVMLGDVCVALGYPMMATPADIPSYDREPSMRLGQICFAAGAPQWVSSSCRLTAGDHGGGLFNLDGRLVGLSVSNPYYHAQHVGIEIVDEHWDELVAPNQPQSQSLAVVPPPQASVTNEIATTEVDRARQATVGIASGPDKPDGFSGVIVSADGYVVTCAHHNLSPGRAVTVHLADGRTVVGNVLRCDPVLDIGLVKIVDKGPWPHAEFGKSTTIRQGDPCIALGYPAHRPDLGTKSIWTESLLRRGNILDASQRYTQIETSCESQGGDSGGGLFNSDGRIIAVHIGNRWRPQVSTHVRIELFQQHWKSLARDQPVPELPCRGLGETAKVFRRAAGNLPAVAVEILGDGKRQSMGTIVGREGWILTKASELYGELSCRLADGQILPAAVIAVSREHDLGLLKVSVDNLPEASWTDLKSIAVGTLIAAILPNEPCAVGVVSQNPHAVLREPGWMTVFARLEATDAGLLVHSTKEIEVKTPIRSGDVIVHVEDRLTPDLKAFVKLTEKPGLGVACVFAGDPIRVGVRRDQHVLELRFALPNESTSDPGQSRRRSAFPSVFDSDVALSPDLCGGPVVDRMGSVVGITIACRTENGRVYIVPAARARKIADQLRPKDRHE